MCCAVILSADSFSFHPPFFLKESIMIARFLILVAFALCVGVTHAEEVARMSVLSLKAELGQKIRFGENAPTSVQVGATSSLPLIGSFPTLASEKRQDGGGLLYTYREGDYTAKLIRETSYATGDSLVLHLQFDGSPFGVALVAGKEINPAARLTFTSATGKITTFVQGGNKNFCVGVSFSI